MLDIVEIRDKKLPNLKKKLFSPVWYHLTQPKH